MVGEIRHIERNKWLPDAWWDKTIYEEQSATDGCAQFVDGIHFRFDNARVQHANKLTTETVLRYDISLLDMHVSHQVAVC